jgi:CRISPR-associated endonuclease Csn1
MVQYLSTVSGQREGKAWLKHQKPRFKQPWEGFRQDVLTAVDKIFVSRAPRRKVTGQAHAETIRSAKYLEQGFSVLKTPLTKVNLATLENLHDKQSNWRLYEVLKQRLEEFNNDPKKAFGNPENPIYMPLSPEKEQAGQKPHIIRSVKICTTQKSGLKVRNGIADNSDMVRIDIFSKKNKKGKEEFYIVPIYVADFTKPVLPNKAFSSGKDGWIEMDETYKFKHSLYKNDLIAVNKSEKPEDELLGYFTGFDRATGAINIELHDRSKLYRGIGAKTLAYIKKYQVDILGTYTEVKKEKRTGNLKRKDVLENSNTQ